MFVFQTSYSATDDHYEEFIVAFFIPDIFLQTSVIPISTLGLYAKNGV